MEIDKLIDLLNKEREYHTSHPNKVYTSVLTSIGTSLAAVVVGIYFSGKTSKSELHNYLEHINAPLVLILFGLGLLLLFIGIMEHSYLHRQQREKIENSLNEILNHTGNFDNEDFWKRHKSHRLETILGIQLTHSTPLITCEPDTRSFWFHDRKFDLGGILIMIAYAILIGHAFFS